jgi:hypothetical protein
MAPETIVAAVAANTVWKIRNASAGIAPSHSCKKRNQIKPAHQNKHQAETNGQNIMNQVQNR